MLVINSINSCAGLLVGTLVGFTGVGGGALMTPILVFLFGIAPQTAVGTDLLFAMLTKTVGGWVHGAHGAIDWLIVRRLWLGSIPSALMTLYFINYAKSHLPIGAVILPMLGVALTITSAGLFFQRRLHNLGMRLRTNFATDFKFMQPGLTVLAGALLGFLVTLTSVGAGAIGTVLLVYLYPYRMKAAKLVGTDIAHAVPLTLVAGLGHLALGNVDLKLLGELLVGSIPGVIAGSLLSHRLNPRWTTRAIAVMLILVAARLFAH